MPGIAPRDGFPQVTSWLQQWPFAMKAPRPWFRAGWTSCDEIDNTGWPNWLLDPPPSLISRQTALPVTMMSRLYDEGFWATDFVKFSHESLRFAVHKWQGNPLRSSFSYNFIPLEVLQRSFAGRQAWPWLAAAGRVLEASGEAALADWVVLRTVDAAGPRVARRRFNHERRRWRGSDTAARAMAAGMDSLATAARARLAEYRAAADDGTAMKAARRDLYHDQARLIAAAGLDIARQAGWEISSLQFSVSECARLEPDRRTAVLRRYLDRSGARIERWFKPFLGSAIAAVAEVRLELLVDTPFGPPPSAGGGHVVQQQHEQQQQQHRAITARIVAAHELLNSTQALVDELGKVVDVLRGSGPAGQGGSAAAAPYTFTLLAERSSDRLHRNRVDRLAQHRLHELPISSPVFTIITACTRILARY
ncbi:hypothetical protein diail_2592 [Diaporthe ilicicola]|nr:hypothetical protein diail_2592 [Diaporthe ilicicola]